MDQTDIRYVLELLSDAVRDQEWDGVLEAREFVREYLNDDGGPIELEEWFMYLSVSLIVIILLLLVVVGLLVKALTIQLGKVRIYTQWIRDLQNRVDVVVDTMHQLDDKQMFSKDDEVGAVFQQMVALVDTLDEKTMRE